MEFHLSALGKRPRTAGNWLKQFPNASAGNFLFMKIAVGLYMCSLHEPVDLLLESKCHTGAAESRFDSNIRSNGIFLNRHVACYEYFT